MPGAGRFPPAAPDPPSIVIQPAWIHDATDDTPLERFTVDGHPDPRRRSMASAPDVVWMDGPVRPEWSSEGGRLDHLEHAFVGGRRMGGIKVGQVAGREPNVEGSVAFLDMVRA